MAALNQVHAGGSYWELWHGDGMSVAVSEKVAKVWEEAKRMGYEAYKAKLVAGGLYRKIEDDTYSEELRRTRRRK
jgi:predicted metalloprotease